ncbi:MAG TPA: hypothetical protein DEQ73_01495 [Phycisphaerales bacterium]|jgi:hypothetical protein|nr:hypothetical protein [Phycisphaerales bacterium]
MMLGALGCQTTDVRTNDGRALPPVPSEIPAPPAGISIDAMTLLVGQRPIDVDGDGYPDRIEAAVALFSEDYAAASLRVPGTFVFELVPRGSDPSAIARWTVASDDPKFQTVDALYGPAWQIALDLREVADPVRPLSWVNLRGSFQPNQGALVKTSEEPRLIQIGRGS